METLLNRKLSLKTQFLDSLHLSHATCGRGPNRPWDSFGTLGQAIEEETFVFTATCNPLPFLRYLHVVCASPVRWKPPALFTTLLMLYHTSNE